MGLDISAYRKATPINLEADEDGEPLDPAMRKAYYNDDLTRLYDLREVYQDVFSAQADGLEPGFYLFEESMGFRAGSYGSYNMWRRALAEVGGYTAEDAHDGKVLAGPFFELVNFSDCEGTIGPKTSAKLLNDFVLLKERAESMMSNYDFQKYEDWTQAFTMASDGGFVSFH